MVVSLIAMNCRPILGLVLRMNTGFRMVTIGAMIFLTSCTTVEHHETDNSKSIVDSVGALRSVPERSPEMSAESPDMHLSRGTFVSTEDPDSYVIVGDRLFVHGHRIAGNDTSRFLTRAIGDQVQLVLFNGSDTSASYEIMSSSDSGLALMYLANGNIIEYRKMNSAASVR